MLSSLLPYDKALDRTEELKTLTMLSQSYCDGKHGMCKAVLKWQKQQNFTSVDKSWTSIPVKPVRQPTKPVSVDAPPLLLLYDTLFQPRVLPSIDGALSCLPHIVEKEEEDEEDDDAMELDLPTVAPPDSSRAKGKKNQVVDLTDG